MITKPLIAVAQPDPLGTLSPKDAAYLARLTRALRCGVPGCDCASGPQVHCPSHDNPAVPTFTGPLRPDGPHGAGEWRWSLPPRNTLQQDATPDEHSNC